ncbi:MAG: hypothetical protein IT280_10370 [Ignavibacteria bacterium]|nr:hypothetical protein [Ignavibacteria bacterium]
MAIIKLISDFDGVWTNQDAEAEFVWNYIINAVAGLTGFTPNEVDNLLNKCKQEMNNTPYEFGWFNNNYLSVYYQEDPFGDNNAIFDYIDRTSSKQSISHFKQNIAAIKEAVNKKAKMSLAEFSNDCFIKSTSQFKLEGKLKPVETAGEIISKLNKNGIEITVVSNSKTEKIEHLFRKTGHKMSNERDIVKGRLIAVGDAKKFIIDTEFKDVPEFFEIQGNFKVNLRRKNYYNILLKEKPDYVIGDVFSLDLALPLYLRLNNPQFSNLKVIQKVQKHTPDWVKKYLGKNELKGIAFMVNSINKLPEILIN